MATSSASSARSGAVQSVERAFDLLELLTDAGGSQGLTQLSEASGLPLPTIHRLMATLTQAGYVRRESSRRYTLGPRLVHPQTTKKLPATSSTIDTFLQSPPQTATTPIATKCLMPSSPLLMPPSSSPTTA